MGGPSKRTKIVATIGPASDSEEMLRRLIDVGMDVARLNFSHRSAELAKPLVERIRKVADEMGVFIGVLGDLRGPRIRVGEMENGSVELQRGKKIILTSENTSSERRRSWRSVSKGSIAMWLPVQSCFWTMETSNCKCWRSGRTGDVLCEIIRGGELKSNKGVNLKNRLVSLPSLDHERLSGSGFCGFRGTGFSGAFVCPIILGCPISQAGAGRARRFNSGDRQDRAEERP